MHPTLPSHPRHTTHGRGALAPKGPALNRNVKVLFIGDSTTAGVGAGPGDVEINGAYPFAVPAQTKAWLNANGVSAISESLAGDNGVTTESGGTKATWPLYRTDVAHSGLTDSSLTPTAGGLLVRLGTGGGYFQLTTTEPVDTVEFAFARSAGSASASLLVDGVAGGTWSMVRATTDYFLHTVSGLALGIHALRWSGSANYVHGPGYINCWNSANKAVQIINAGRRNWKTADWIGAANPASPLNAIGTIRPDIAVIDVGINDYRQSGTTIATTKANIQSIINKVTSLGGKVILVVPNPISAYSTVTDAWSQAAVLAMYQQLAAENSGIPLVDAPAAYFAAGLSGATNPATWAALGANMYDVYHPKAGVYAVEAAAVGAAIKTMCQTQGWLA